jgi:hypothetical protein
MGRGHRCSGMDSTSQAVPPSSGPLPADRPYAELTSGPWLPAPAAAPGTPRRRLTGRGGPEPSGVQWASFADLGALPRPATCPEPAAPLLRPWGTGTGGPAAAGQTGAVPAVPVPRGIPVL